MIYKMWNKRITFDNSKTTEMLGINFIPMDTMLKDMVPTLIHTGYLPEGKKGKK